MPTNCLTLSNRGLRRPAAGLPTLPLSRVHGPPAGHVREGREPLLPLVQVRPLVGGEGAVREGLLQLQVGDGLQLLRLLPGDRGVHRVCHGDVRGVLSLRSTSAKKQTVPNRPVHSGGFSSCYVEPLHHPTAEVAKGFTFCT